MVRVGRVEAVYWGRDASIAAALAEDADEDRHFPGMPSLPAYPIRLIVTRSAARYDSVTHGRLPSWSGAAAFPAANTIVLKLDGDLDPHATLRHELAHLALHHLAVAIPRWFDEGYAAYAAGEWGRLDALTVNWELVRRGPPTLRALDHQLREGSERAEAAYALATTAVMYLARLGGARGLGPLLTNLRQTRDFEVALRQTHLMTMAQFETAWQADVTGHYGWLRLLGSFTVFWSIVGVVLLSLWGLRRRRDRARRAALDEDWVIPADETDDRA